MDYRMPWRSVEPLDTQWGGALYEYVDYVLTNIESAWQWDEPAHAKTLAAALTPEQLALWAIVNADGQVCNGGFSQFFFNSYGELAEEALQGFQMFGMTECAEIFREAYAAFAVRPITKDRELRIAMIEQLIDSDDGDGGEETEGGTPESGGESVEPGSEALQYYSALAKGTEQHWEALESRYYDFIHRKGVRGGYNAAFYSPLASFIEAHPQAFFLPQVV